MQVPNQPLELVEASFKDNPITLTLPEFTSDHLTELGMTRIDWWQVRHFSTYLTKFMVDPWEYLGQLGNLFSFSRLTTTLWLEPLLSGEPVPPTVTKTLLNHLSKVGISQIQLIHPLNDTASFIEFMSHPTELSIIPGLVIDPNVPLVDAIKNLRSFNPKMLSLVNWGGVLRSSQLHKILEEVEVTLNCPVHLALRANNNIRPLLIDQALQDGVRSFDVQLIAPTSETSLPQASEVAQIAEEHDPSLPTSHALVEVEERLREHIPRVEHHQTIKAQVRQQARYLRIPPAVVTDLDTLLHDINASSNISEILTELTRVRQELGNIPLVPPFTRWLVSQATFNVLYDKSRYFTVPFQVKRLLNGWYGSTPTSPTIPVDLPVARQPSPRELREASSEGLVEFFAPQATHVYRQRQVMNLGKDEETRRQSVALLVTGLTRWLEEQVPKTALPVTGQGGAERRDDPWRMSGRLLQMGRWR